jgi:hypothetical protein
MLARMYSDGGAADGDGLGSLLGVLKIEPEVGTTAGMNSAEAGGRVRPVSKMRMAQSFRFFSNPAAKNSVDAMFHAKLLQGRPPYKQNYVYKAFLHLRKIYFFY